jgi:exosortase
MDLNSNIQASSEGVTPRDARLIGGAVALIAAMIAVYSPVLYYMTLHWGEVDDYSHGFLIAPLALYFAWERRYRLRGVPIEGSWWGLVPLVLGVAALTVGRLGVELTSMRTGFVLTLIGLILLLLGRKIFRVLAFPLLFLFLMVPLPQSLVNTVAFPLQLMAASAAVESLHILGVPAVLEGNIIHQAPSEFFVAQACSGLRSLMALLTLGVVFAYFLQRGSIRRVIIVLSTIPIAIFVNAFRVALTGILAHNYGNEAATGIIHDFQGLITFFLAFLVLLVEARLLNLLVPSVGLAPSPARAGA